MARLPQLSALKGLSKHPARCERALLLVLGCPYLRRQLEIFGPIGYHASLAFEGIPVLLSGPAGSRGWMVKSAQVFALAFVLVGAVAFPGSVSARAFQSSESQVEWAQLPPEARATHRLILAGGPFRYAKDGSVFANREKLLPAKPKGFYREYTVPAPAAADRGARRMVCGGRPRVPEACFYSGDHYASFGLIVQ